MCVVKALKYTRPSPIDIHIVIENPNLLDLMANGDIQLILNTPNGKGARTDEGRIRSAAVTHGVPCVTTLSGCVAVAHALEALAANPVPRVTSLQEWLALR